jgi:hypothetical protein
MNRSLTFNFNPALRTMLVLLPLAAITSGCGQPTHEPAISAIFDADAAAIAATKKADPWQTSVELRAIEARLEGTCTTSVWTGSTSCGNLTERQMRAKAQELDHQSERYELAAVKQGNPSAVLAAYSATTLTAPYVALVPHVVALADKARGTAEDRPLLLVAGQLYASGRYVVKDTTRAVGYLSKAWAAGFSDAAIDAAALYLEINDYRNAYLWSLRCIGTCDRGKKLNLSLEYLQTRLSPEAARQAQTSASDGSIVELDTKHNGGQLAKN